MAPMTGVIDKDIQIDLTKWVDDIIDKKVLIVGGTSGLGQAIAQEVAKLGAKVKVVGRSFKDEGVPNISFEKSDLSSVKEAKRLGESALDTDYDIVVLTVGILAAGTRQENSEGLEMDLAVSYLSRFVILKYLVPRLKKGARVFIMGFPGANTKDFKIDDLNSEKGYSNLGFTHLNTVAGNEALVLYYAATDKDHVYFGLNPGLIKTNIRSIVWESGYFTKVLGGVMEFLIGVFGTSAQTYGKTISQLIFAEGLEQHSGIHFNPAGKPILKSEYFKDDPTLASTIIAKSQELLTEKAGV